MKKAGLIIPFLLLTVSPAFADNITTGSVTSEVNVNTNINGTNTNDSKSNIKTHIYINNNGEEKTLDEEGPGNYSLSSNSDGGNTSVNVSANSEENQEDNASTTSAFEKHGTSASNSAKETPKEVHKTPVSLIVGFFQGVGGFLLRVIRNL